MSLVLAVFLVVLSFYAEAASFTGNLLLNLGTEIMGITLTVAIVDWLFENARRHDEAVRIAWEMLYDIHHAVWVWQGGSYEFNLRDLLSGIYYSSPPEPDPIARSTKDVLMHLGRKARATVHFRGDIIQSNPDLKTALENINFVTWIGERKDQLYPDDFRLVLFYGTIELAEMVGLTDFNPEKYGLGPSFNAAVESQKERYYRAKALETVP